MTIMETGKYCDVRGKYFLNRKMKLKKRNTMNMHWTVYVFIRIGRHYKKIPQYIFPHVMIALR